MTEVSVADPTCEPLVGASIGEATARFFARAFTVRGRASRSEYWWWMLVNVAVLGFCQFLMPWLISGRTPQPTLQLGPFGSLFFAHFPLWSVPESDAPTSALAAFFLIVAGIWLLVTVIPGVTVLVRRLHDSDLSGRWAFLAVLPLGSVLLLLFALRRSRAEGARFDG